MKRSAFLRRMAVAALASAFIDVERLLPGVGQEAGAWVPSASSSEAPPLRLEDLQRLINKIYADSVIPAVYRGNPLLVSSRDLPNLLR